MVSNTPRPHITTGKDPVPILQEAGWAPGPVWVGRNIGIIIIYLFTAIGLSPVGSGYSTCKQNMKLVTTKFKSGGLHEKHVVATGNLGNHLSICL